MVGAWRALRIVHLSALVGLTGCGTTLISHPIERQSDGWTVRLDRMAEGYDSPPLGAGLLTPGTIYKPDDGQRFLHLYLKIRNDAATRRPFHYDQCDLDLGDRHIEPGLVINYNGPVHEIPTPEAYDAGEESARWLIFSYPEHRYPTRLQCQALTIDFPPLSPAGN
jgi:hypothetical protein